MMRIILVLCCCFFSAVAIAQQDSLLLSGDIKGQGDQKVFISFSDASGKTVRYSATAQNDKFSLKIAKQSQPVVARLSSGAAKNLSKVEDGKNYGSPAPALSFFIYNTDISVKGEIDYPHLAIVKGGRENDEFVKYSKAVEKMEKKNWEISKKVFFMSRNTNSLVIRKLMAESTDNHKKIREQQKDFIKNNPGSFGSLFLLGRMENLYTTGDYEDAFAGLTDEYKNTVLGQQIEKRIAFLSPTAPGKLSVPFTRIDKDGKEINLTDYKGKIVLLDFWGSWCAPCRASHPHLKELYAKYKDKGFEIIAVAQETAKAMEARKEKWLEAIEKDGISWVHVMNNDGSELIQDIVKDYRVTAFPTKILLDTDGKILLRITASATDDVDKMLEKKLSN